jgi:hypothetical protein
VQTTVHIWNWLHNSLRNSWPLCCHNQRQLWWNALRVNCSHHSILNTVECWLLMVFLVCPLSCLKVRFTTLAVSQVFKVKQSLYRPVQAIRVSRPSAHEGFRVFSPAHLPFLPPKKYSWLSRPQDYIMSWSGFGGLEVSCRPLVPKFVFSHPAKAVRFLGRKNPQHAFLRRGSKAIGPMS